MSVDGPSTTQRLAWAGGAAAVTLPAAGVIAGGQYRAFQAVDRTGRAASHIVDQATNRWAFGNRVGVIGLSMGAPMIAGVHSLTNDAASTAAAGAGLATIVGAGLLTRTAYSVSHDTAGTFRPLQPATNVQARLARAEGARTPVGMPLLRGLEQLLRR